MITDLGIIRRCPGGQTFACDLDFAIKSVVKGTESYAALTERPPCPRGWSLQRQRRGAARGFWSWFGPWPRQEILKKILTMPRSVTETWCDSQEKSDDLSASGRDMGGFERASDHVPVSDRDKIRFEWGISSCLGHYPEHDLIFQECFVELYHNYQCFAHFAKNICFHNDSTPFQKTTRVSSMVSTPRGVNARACGCRRGVVCVLL